jgi:hypothetical protein
MLEALPEDVLGYRRADLIVLANMGTQPVTVRYAGTSLAETGEVAVGTGRVSLFPDSAVILQTVVPKLG